MISLLSKPIRHTLEKRLKAITYSNYGPPEVLQLKEVDKPVPKDDEILIRVRAVEATKSDCEMRSFNFAVKWFWLPLRLALGVRKPRRQILGGYFSGEVETLGKDVTEFSEGDRVFGAAGLKLGAYGEYVALPTSYTIVAKPGNMSFADAAAVPLGGLNAIHFLRLAKIQARDKVLINGAGGSIGAHAVQIAKSMGAEVTAVDSAIKEDLLRSLGADHFIDYSKENFAATGRTYDVIFDMVAGNSYSASIRALNPNGRYLTANPRLSVMLRSVFTSRFSNKTARFAFAGEAREDLLALRQMIEDGKIKSIVDRVYPMDRAALAHSRVETEQRLGAVVIAIGDRADDSSGSRRTAQFGQSPPSNKHCVDPIQTVY
ncbi:MAG: NAD(P)-dependent alcohol dehydrogenase [Woeseiaceae bacterium]